MGADFNVYRGPTVRTNDTYTATEEIHTCPNEICEDYLKYVQGKFCSECGTETGLVKHQVKRDVNLRDILAELGDEDYLMETPYSDGLFLCNNDFGNFYGDDDFSTSLLSVDPESELSRFLKDPIMISLFRYCIDHGITLSVDYEIVGYWS